MKFFKNLREIHTGRSFIRLFVICLTLKILLTPIQICFEYLARFFDKIQRVCDNIEYYLYKLNMRIHDWAFERYKN
jgi:hypothetical protein